MERRLRGKEQYGREVGNVQGKKKSKDELRDFGH